MNAQQIYNFRVSTYAKAVYVYGTNRLTARDGYNGIATDYVEPVKEYAATGLVNGTPYPVGATGFTDDQLLFALASGWITQDEFDATMANKITE